MMMKDSLPGVKRFLGKAKVSEHEKGFLVRLMTAFIMHLGRMSASQAAGAIRTQARHRAAVIRFLAERKWSGDWCVLEQLARLVLEAETASGGTWAFIVDQTLCGQQGKKTENTFSTGNRQRRPRKGRRYQKYHYARKSCHCFVMGLLLTPSGIRIPCWRSYYTKEYCKHKGRPHRTQTELAAELIQAAVVPEGANAVVLGDTAFDAESIRDACAARGFAWIVPMNPERVLAGPKGKRRKVRSLVEEFSANQFAPVRLTPGQGTFVEKRRIARCRLGPKVKTRTLYVHRERREVHSVGEVQLVFSTKERPKRGQAVQVQKILMTNDRKRSAAEVVELYTLRWQIELFFKELKSTLGLHQYRFRRFEKVQSWVATCLLTFLYLEWYRAGQLRRRDLTAEEKSWWRWQRSYGLGVAVRQEAEEAELICLAEWTRTPTGVKKLKRLLRAARPLEYRRPGENKAAA
jgi:Transposase DDE domain